MTRLHILFSDPYTSSETEMMLVEKSGFFVFNFNEQFMAQLIKRETTLSQQMQAELDSGNLLTTQMLEKVLRARLSEMTHPHILLTGFPRSVEQFLMLQNLLADLDIKLQTVWHIRLQNPEVVLQHFESKKSDWQGKFADEMTPRFERVLRKNRELVAHIQKTTDIRCEIIETSASISGT